MIKERNQGKFNLCKGIVNCGRLLPGWLSSLLDKWWWTQSRINGWKPPCCWGGWTLIYMQHQNWGPSTFQQPGRQLGPHKARLMGETSHREWISGSLGNNILWQNPFYELYQLKRSVSDSFTNFEHGGEWHCTFTVSERRPETRFGKIRINQRTG